MLSLRTFERASSRMVQRQQQIMGEPSEREALLTILLSYACKGVLRSYLALGCERTFLLPAEGWLYLYVWTICPCILCVCDIKGIEGI
jgi:hypothetical protein